jgi:uncharacterized protein (DUF58 family)
VTLSTRGRALGAVVVAAFLLAQLHGARALGAIVVPGVIVLAVAAWQVARVPVPAVAREPPEEGPVGRRGTVRLTVEPSDAGQLLVRDQLSAGLEPVAASETTPDQSAAETRRDDAGTPRDDESPPDADPPPGPDSDARSPFGVPEWLANWLGGPLGGDDDSTATVRVVSGSTSAYDVRFRARGEWSLGPAQIVVRDALGLFERAYETADTDTVLVFPPVRRLLPDAYRQLLTAAGAGSGEERTVFDGLREYDPGDPLRDIHWRTSAKRDELVVAEYTAGSTDDRVTIDAGATPDGVDAMAEAAGSLALALLDAGIPVELHVPGTSVVAGPGERRAVLASLARLTADDVSGSASDATVGEADVRVDAKADRVDVRIGDVESQFETLVGESRAADRSRQSDSWFSEPETVVGPNRHGEPSAVEEQTTP